MKQLLTISLFAISICLNAQGGVLEVLHEVNNQTERITSCSKIESIAHGQSYGEDVSNNQ